MTAQRVVMVVDMQNGVFATPRLARERCVAQINRLVRAADRVIFIQHDEAGGLEAGSEGFALLPELEQPAGALYVTKTACDAFYHTSLAQVLDEHDIQQFVICGCATDYCLDTTIKNGASRGYGIVIAEDAHTTADRPAAQRVQEDTMRFASTLEDMGVSFINAVMTLIAFLPVLVTLSEHVPDLPIVGHLPYGLVIAAIVWSLMGTGLLAVVGIKLPGLEFKNQRVEAAYRKELVYGEDDETRATPPTVRELFRAVRRNYFRLYFHYMYFNIARILYLQVDNVFGLFLLFPSIVAGTITLGLMTQITNVFGQVRGSFQYLISSWTTLVELMSIYKRLRSFERELDGKPLQEAIPTLR